MNICNGNNNPPLVSGQLYDNAKCENGPYLCTTNLQLFSLKTGIMWAEKGFGTLYKDGWKDVTAAYCLQKVK